jgi:hypothetical protein
LIHVVQLAASGSEKTVAHQLHSYLDVGTTKVVISPVDRSSSVDCEAPCSLAARL